MKTTSSRARRAHRPRAAAAAAALVLVALCATLLPAAAFGETPGPEPSPPVTTVTCALSSAAVVYGGAVTVSGVVEPATEGREVAILLDDLPVATALTAADGTYAADVVFRRSGDVRAAVTADGAVSEPQALVVRPHVRVTRGAAVPFLRTRYVLRVTPASYTGTVSARIEHRGVNMGTVKARCRDGRAVLLVPLRGIERFTVTFRLPAGDGLGARSVPTTVDVKWRKLAVGSSGAHVKGMLTGLQRLRIRTPGLGTTYTAQCADAVMAFQKAYGLSRTYRFGYADWRKLDRAKRVKPRYAKPATHLEVDKRRQILMVVKDGAVHGLIAVSTGATGNTPEGSFRIQRKTPVTSGLYGPDFLYRTMGFIGNFAIHGYRSVPPYPASHGCVREPLWVADWVYRQSFVGERLYIYR
jgi:hypothetical protein